MALALTATFNSIGVECPVSPTYVGQPVLTFRKAGSGPFLPVGFPLWRSASDGFFGSVLFCQPATDYEVKVTYPDTTFQSGTVTTRADNIPIAAVLVPTHFLSPLGNDSNAGAMPSSAWRTIEKAMASAPANAVVEMFAGEYIQSYTSRTTPITFVGANRPVVAAPYASLVLDSEMVPTAEPTLWAIVRAVPVIPANSGAWTSVSLTGPRTGQPQQIWKTTVAGLNPFYSALNLGYSPTALGLPQRLATWDRKGAVMGTIAGTIELMRTNQTYGFGTFWEYNTRDIYVRMPGDANPNGFYWTPGGVKQNSSDSGAAFNFNGPNCRVSQIAMFGCGVQFGGSAVGGIVDNCLLNMASVSTNGGKPSTYATNLLVQDNRIEDSNTWGTGANVIPWLFIKDYLKQFDGSNYEVNRIGAGNESGGIGGSGGARNSVFRRNTIDGPFNGFTWYNAGFDRNACRDTDVYGNIVRHCGDDGLEPEQFGINIRFWNNDQREVLTHLSLGPVANGPVFDICNVAWQVGGYSPVGFKYSGSSSPRARVFVANLTMWTDSPGCSGWEQYAGGGANTEQFDVTNSLVRVTRTAVKAPLDAWAERNNHFVTTDAARGLNVGAVYKTNVAGYRTATQQGVGTNTRGDFITPAVLDNALVNPAGGNLAIKPGDAFATMGIAIPTVTDQFTAGAIPMGAFRIGNAVVPPPPPPPPPPPGETILASITEVQAALTAANTDLEAIKGSLNALPADAQAIVDAAAALLALAQTLLANVQAVGT